MSREQIILEAAEQLFFERSFDGVGVDAIGKAAGVTGSAIYRHFDSKDEILSALFDQITDSLLVRVGEPLDDPAAELEQLVDAHVEFAMRHERLAGIWMREQHALHQSHRRHVIRRQRRYMQRWISCLDKCYPGHDQDELVATVRAMHALISSDATRPPAAKRTQRLQPLLTNLARAALDGLATPIGQENRNDKAPS